MFKSESTLEYEDDKNTEFDLYGDTRNNKKHNELKFYSKHSYTLKERLRIYNLKKKKEINKENELESDLTENNVKFEKVLKIKKRELKIMNENDKEYGNNYEPINVKEKKAKRLKRPKKR